MSVQTAVKIDICDLCAMKGIVMLKPFMGPGADRYLLTQDTSDSLPLKWQCVTCRETPAGVRSANLNHQRLPESEYKLPAK